ncbi:hypothetical protein L1987_66326 [Smallanthus sonchifolius]|uniref:Uncharacterized protein n=1 Tax=Smallanthus sonchifolius TaxID=185202 RepID=A0ACB9BX42_9ASTR|nr:hypothetical protein L1987_66326 [Smallanthus sonchifolius]
MSRFVEKPANVVDIIDSDDEEPEVENKAGGDRSLENRSFWIAGAFDIGPTKWTPSQGELEHARVHPKFLHSNATSHKWAFGAIAELLDNAVDEINNGATFVKVDRIYSRRDNSPALLFLDDGGGMDPDGVRKCMSLGYSTKKTNNTIGQCKSCLLLEASVFCFGIVGVLEANFIEPAHDKQDFERPSVYSRLETKLKQMQMDYWNKHQPQKTSDVPIQTQGEESHHISPTPGRAANPRLDLSGSETGSHGKTVYNNDMSTVWPPPGFQTLVAFTHFFVIVLVGMSLIQREQYLQRETELKTTAEDLEKQVAETKRRCAELSSRIDLMRRQKHMYINGARLNTFAAV